MAEIEIGCDTVVGQRIDGKPKRRNLTHYLSVSDRYSAHTQFH
jgi:hypothetical protein